MIRRLSCLTLAVVVYLACAGNSVSQQPAPAPQAAKPAAAARGQTPYTPADVHFVAGMIGHHAQAIQMAGWAPSHSASPSVRVLCERIVVAQTDEIAFAQRWLREHGEYVPPADPRGHHAGDGGADAHAGDAHARANGAARLGARSRLRSPVSHVHDSAPSGAITMVQQLLAVPGAAQDGPIFRFASDVNADQTTEINRMTLMLEDLKRSSQ
jgi:uncharacterized protein (DUF305 family)